MCTAKWQNIAGSKKFFNYGRFVLTNDLTIFFCFSREKAKTDMNEIQSASHRVVPEIEHLLKSAVSTNIHDLGSHTVSVTHLDLDQKVGKCYPNYISEFLRGQAKESELTHK